MIAIEVSEIEDVRDKKGNRTNLTANNFSVFFGVNNKGGLNINALKARQLLIENPGNWIETKSKFKPLLLLIDELIDKHIKDYQLS